MNNPFDYTPDAACEAAFRKLLGMIGSLKDSDRPDDADFLRELEAGKMLGVLIAVDDGGVSHELYAFSGQLGKGGFNRQGFVGPVFDYLEPDGYFKKKEAEISRRNLDISRFEQEILPVIESDFRHAKSKMDEEVAAFKERCLQSKAARKERRDSGEADEREIAVMIRQSQFEKAELHRLKKRLAAGLEPLTDRLEEARSHLERLKEKRRSDSEALQQWLFSNFRLLNARGESRSLRDIFADTAMKVPPSGAGECCAPKLLHAAYVRGWKPVSIAEYWYGRPKGGEVRIHGSHYPACRGKCLPVLRWMLQGLEIDPPLDGSFRSAAIREPEVIFENEWFCVVNKPEGMLSVPGKGAALSVQDWLTERYRHEKTVKMAHRLDLDTSGLIIATFGEESYSLMQSLFALRKVRKTYVAELSGDYRTSGIPERGRIELPLSPDWLDRPRQRVDFESGKEAVTDYEFIGVVDGRSRVKFIPHTGRTHQLRVHAASSLGLGMPIAGDRLYGKDAGAGAQRLHLHARKIEFTFPLDGKHYCFEIPVPF